MVRTIMYARGRSSCSGQASCHPHTLFILFVPLAQWGYRHGHRMSTPFLEVAHGEAMSTTSRVGMYYSPLCCAQSPIGKHI